MASTIYNVAQRAGVSISTVSLVMNKPERVSAESREKVLRAVDELGYVPKSDAVSRARRGIGRIGVVAPFSTYLSSAERLNGIFEELSHRARTTEVVAIDHESAAVTESPLLESLPLTSSLDGLIVMGITPSADAVGRFRRQELPVVLLGVDEYLGLSTVSIAEAAGARAAAENLHGRGYRRFLYIGERQVSDEYLSQSQLRQDGFLSRLEELGVAREDIDVLHALNDLQSACAVMTAHLQSTPQPLGVFAYCDLMAAGAIRAVRESGRELRADVGVIGFDDGDLARALGLTTVTQPLHESGRVAVHLLLQAMERPGRLPTNARLATQLVERDT
ncbi:MAG: LacI family DNA-binding transcriptional regulator [Microbacterium sp.]